MEERACGLFMLFESVFLYFYTTQKWKNWFTLVKNISKIYFLKIFRIFKNI